MINTIILGNALIELPKLPSGLINCCITSPPYWRLRNYGIEPIIWDGDKNCNHEFNEYDSKLLHENRQNLDGGTLGNPEYRENLHGFGNAKAGFCLKCGAWRGNLGLEPTLELYIKHLCDIFDEIKRVLRDDGVCFVNIGDSYGGSGNASGHKEHTRNLGYKTLEMGASRGNQKTTRGYEKSLLDIPYRFSIEMTNRGWIKRNTIIWYKKNCMPSSANDRFTIDFEYLFFFTKNNKAIFWTNEKTLECVSKKPLGTKGIEGKDWEWRPCPACFKRKENIKNKVCPRCKGLRKIKYSFWSGHDYWFDQQFDEHTTKDDLDRRKNKFWSENIADGGSGKQNKGRDRREFYGKQGRNKRCVWTIPTKPFPKAHFAVYPEGLIEIPIKARCPEFICKKCGKARVKIYKNHRQETRPGNYSKYTDDCYVNSKRPEGLKKRIINNPIEIGYSDCGCNAGWKSGIVLDPFMGAGTTALVALTQRKRFIGIEIKQSYIDMSYKRIARVQQRIF